MFQIINQMGIPSNYPQSATLSSVFLSRPLLRASPIFKHIQISHGWLFIPITLWLFNIAMEHGPFVDDFPIKTSIYKGFSRAMLNNQMVHSKFLPVNLINFQLMDGTWPLNKQID